MGSAHSPRVGDRRRIRPLADRPIQQVTLPNALATSTCLNVLGAGGPVASERIITECFAFQMNIGDFRTARAATIAQNNRALL
jgi:hypothetical protein